MPGGGGGNGLKASSIANLFFDPNGNTLGGASGVAGGAQVGYNYQLNQFVIGVEADFQGTGISSGGGASALVPVIASPYGSGFLIPVGALTGSNVSLEWFGTVRGRAGFLVLPTLLLYGTGGFAYGQVDAFGFSNTPTGWTAGGGAEWMFAPNWSAKAEYLYIDLNNNGATGGQGFNYGYFFHPEFNVVRAGINYHFNFGAEAPVVAWY